MKTAKLLYILLTAITGAGFIFLSCNKSNSSGSGHLQVMLTDGPANYDAVYIDMLCHATVVALFLSLFFNSQSSLRRRP
jgi:hypothetical protein